MYGPPAFRRLVVTPGIFTPYTDQFYGSSSLVAGSVAVPVGASSVTIRLESAGGGGSRLGGVGANGGGGGAYAEKVSALDHAGGGADDGGKVFTYSIGIRGQGRQGSAGSGVAGGDCTVTGTVTAGAVSLSATGGAGGTNLAPGAGGVATGGSTNVNGSAGGGEQGGTSGSGIFGGAEGQHGDVGGAGGGPGDRDDFLQLDGGNGGVARLSFAWT